MKNDVDILKREKFIETVVNIVENLVETDIYIRPTHVQMSNKS